MDDQLPPINPNDLIIFKNIDNEDFEWQYNAIVSPLPYYIHAGETRELPYHIARHGVEKLIDKMLIKQGQIHTSLVLRAELRKQIVLGKKSINYERPKTPDEIALEVMRRKKDLDPYVELFKERDIEAKQREIMQKQQQQPAAPLYKTSGTAAKPIGNQIEHPANPGVNQALTQAKNEANIPASDPERQKIYSLLITKMHLDLNHEKTKEILDSKSVDQLREEFKYELPELVNPAAAIVPDTKASLSESGMPVNAQNPNPPMPGATFATPPAPPPPAPPGTSASPVLDSQLRAAGA